MDNEKQPRPMWIGFKHGNGTAFVCPLDAFPQLVQPGEAMQLLVVGIDGYKVAGVLVTMGLKPEMRFVHAHIKGKSRVGRPPQPVICDQTQHIYPSINEASRATGIAVGNLSQHLRFPAIFKTVSGVTFKYYKGA